MIFNDGGGIFADDPRDREPDEEELQRHILERKEIESINKARQAINVTYDNDSGRARISFRGAPSDIVVEVNHAEAAVIIGRLSRIPWRE